MKKFNFHFFNRSLRTRLLLSLAAIHLLTIAAVSIYFYSSYGDLMETLKDDQLEQVADAYAANPQISHLHVHREGKSTHTKSVIEVQIWDHAGKLQASTKPSLAIPLQKTVGLHTISTDAHQSWRVYTRKGELGSQIGTIQVIHDTGYMQALIWRRALSSIIPLLLLFPLSFGVIWLVIRRVSRDLKNASVIVASQDTHRLADFTVQQVPDELTPLVEAYNSALQRLSKAFDTQRHFLQDAAHELRTPVTAISLQLENLRPHIAPGEATERFNQLEAGVIRTRHLVGQLLSLTRQEGSEVGLNITEDLDLRLVLKESIEQLMVLADRRGIDIGFSGETSAWIKANRQELRSLFDNLINNAMKHTPPGSVVDVVLKVDHNATVVEIIDNGPGIPEEHIHRAFERFARFNHNETLGSGLGLAIVKSIADRYRLKVEVANLYNDERICGLCARVIHKKEV
ncbi:sensor histidine kinase [Buttiauxella brennerae]|uniref:sensor histidine kinase n=1 Tax=Buttiauxella brennerae TaxID=82988 RepID=UPI00286EBE48|nr:HAMP domain-containing sensor histidine kinase [Buttiauxella brennerae]